MIMAKWLLFLHEGVSLTCVFNAPIQFHPSLGVKPTAHQLAPSPIFQQAYIQPMFPLVTPYISLLHLLKSNKHFYSHITLRVLNTYLSLKIPFFWLSWNNILSFYLLPVWSLFPCLCLCPWTPTKPVFISYSNPKLLLWLYSLLRQSHLCSQCQFPPI